MEPETKRRRHHKLSAAGRMARDAAPWLRDFVWFSLGALLFVMALKAWPLLGEAQGFFRQSTATMQSLGAASDQLKALAAQGNTTLAAAIPVLDEARATVAELRSQVATLGGLISHTDRSVNGQLLPQITENLKTLNATEEAARKTVEEGRLAVFDLRQNYLNNPHILATIENYDEASGHVNAITRHGEQITADAQVAADYGREKIEALRKPKTWVKVGAAWTLGFGVKVLIETLAHVISGN